MTKTKKIVLSIIISIVSLSLVMAGILFYQFNRKGDLLAQSTSPNGRWKIKAYVIDSGAMASAIYYADVKDLKSKRPAYTIELSSDQINDSKIQWKSEYIVNILGEIVDVRNSSSQLVGISTSPNYRWRVSIFFIHDPESTAMDFYYAQISDEKEEPPISHDIRLSPGRLVSDKVHWKNNNVIDIYGVLIDVRAKSRKQPSSSLSNFLKTDHLSKVSSQNKRWKIKIYREWAGLWPIGGYHYYAKVIDLKGQVPTHNIDLSEAKIPKKNFQDNRVRWRTKYTADIYGQIVDIRTGSSDLDRTLISPGGRWKVRVYFPETGESAYIEVIDLKGKMPFRRMYTSCEFCLGDSVRWENKNNINLWGEKIDVRTSRNSQVIEN